MIDAALIQKCADPSLTVAVVEQFLTAAGAEDPLSLAIKSDGRLLLVPKPRTSDEALGLVRKYVGKAGVRVGITQLPAGLGVTEAARLDVSLFDACANLETGTAMFAKIARIVTRWYGSPTNKDILPQMLDDAIYAWKTGYFEGTEVFQAADPGGATFLSGEGARPNPSTGESEETPATALEEERVGENPIGTAEIRIDLSRIGGRN